MTMTGGQVGLGVASVHHEPNSESEYCYKRLHTTNSPQYYKFINLVTPGILFTRTLPHIQTPPPT